MTDDRSGEGLDRAGFGRLFRERSPAERRRFVAGLLTAAGWDTSVDGPVVTAVRADDPPGTRRVLIPGAAADEADTDAAVDVVLADTGAESPAGTGILAPDDLYRRARYDLDRATADDLFRRHFGRPMAAGDRATDGSPASGGSAGDSTTDGSRPPDAAAGDSTADDPPPADDAATPASAGVAGSDRPLHTFALGAGIGAAVAVLVLAAAGIGGTPLGAATPDGPSTTGLPSVGSHGPDDRDLETRYAGLRPTCERPPGVVVAIQVGALKHNDAATNRGVRTAWRFTAPSYRRATGSFPSFVETVTGAPYASLVNHDRTVLGPVERADSEIGRDEGVDAVDRTAVVFDATGNASAFEFSLTEQDGGEYGGCWMTVSVTPVPLDEVRVPGVTEREITVTSDPSHASIRR
ncbi:MAG: hypothetical protein ABEH78_10765 [Haloferacaceae archaeon]